MASRGVNKVILIGNLGKDPEIRTMPNGESVANFSIATSETWKDQAGQEQSRVEWHNIVAYRKLAEIVGQYVRKGGKVYIEGSLRTRKWQDKNGQDRYTTEIIADQMQMLDGKPADGGERQASAPRAQPQPQERYAPPAAGGAPDFDDDIPF